MIKTKMNCSNIFAGVILICTVKILGTEANRVNYGVKCDSRFNRCNSAAWLSCQYGICNCSKPDEMVYSVQTRSCVVRAGERCRYAMGDETANYEFLDCVEHAECDQRTFTCKCAVGFYESEHGHCQKLKGRQDQCNSTLECLSQFQCVEHQCDCDPATSRFAAIPSPTPDSDEEYEDEVDNLPGEGACVGNIGKPCIKSLCVESSRCVQTSSGTKCSCAVGFYDAGGQCFREYGQSCSNKETQQCGPNFNCVDGVCRCKFPINQIYSSDATKCVSTNYGPCEDSGCVNNSECVQATGFKECRCKAGYVDVDGFCDKDHGSSCDSTGIPPISYMTLTGGQTELNFQGRCDRKARLKCVNGICNCVDGGQIYNRKRRSCDWLVGYKCGGENVCTENASCHTASSPILPALCACNDGFTVTPNRTCINKILAVFILE